MKRLFFPLLDSSDLACPVLDLEDSVGLMDLLGLACPVLVVLALEDSDGLVEDLLVRYCPVSVVLGCPVVFVSDEKIHQRC